ncbi:2'-5' RNA ligase family protein [Kribbella sp. NPDC051770]|uniref:2'-5' RNA ligase family protein n=1 Tax=Kribbella sp. NPDC051770 TaxID=3155413 RepID=UPI00342C2A9E
METTSPEPPLILTLGLDEHSTAIFDDLRRRHFPAHLNRVGAHLTLFHQLPGDRLDNVLADLHEIRPAPFDLVVTRPRLLGRGVAIDLRSAQLTVLHRQLSDRWQPWLVPQDRQPFRPHITVQNKVDPTEARRLHSDLAEVRHWPTALATDWSLWRYLGGPWAAEAQVPFGP